MPVYTFFVSTPRPKAKRFSMDHAFAFQDSLISTRTAGRSAARVHRHRRAGPCPRPPPRPPRARRVTR